MQLIDLLTHTLYFYGAYTQMRVYIRIIFEAFYKADAQEPYTGLHMFKKLCKLKHLSVI